MVKFRLDRVPEVSKRSGGVRLSISDGLAASFAKLMVCNVEFVCLEALFFINS
jgi:hypothetical protein